MFSKKHERIRCCPLTLYACYPSNSLFSPPPPPEDSYIKERSFLESDLFPLFTPPVGLFLYLAAPSMALRCDRYLSTSFFLHDRV